MMDVLMGGGGGLRGVCVVVAVSNGRHRRERTVEIGLKGSGFIGAEDSGLRQRSGALLKQRTGEHPMDSDGSRSRCGPGWRCGGNWD